MKEELVNRSRQPPSRFIHYVLVVTTKQSLQWWLAERLTKFLYTR